MEQKVIEIIARILGVDVEDVEMDTSIGDLPGWDSLHHLQIIVELQNEFNVKYSQEDLVELEDISDLIALTKDLAQ